MLLDIIIDWDVVSEKQRKVSVVWLELLFRIRKAPFQNIWYSAYSMDLKKRY